MCWVLSGSKRGEKRQKSTVQGSTNTSVENGQSRASLGRSVSVADGKDHFFKNLIPSFVKRGGDA